MSRASVEAKSYIRHRERCGQRQAIRPAARGTERHGPGGSNHQQHGNKSRRN